MLEKNIPEIQKLKDQVQLLHVFDFLLKAIKIEC